MVKIFEYTDKNKQSPFSKWFSKLDPIAAAKITTALYRLELGNFSNVKSVGSGILEYKIYFGPGYRIYFAHLEKEIILLVAGGTKKNQSKDIHTAKERWAIYKANNEEK